MAFSLSIYLYHFKDWECHKVTKSQKVYKNPFKTLRERKHWGVGVPSGVFPKNVPPPNTKILKATWDIASGPFSCQIKNWGILPETATITKMDYSFCWFLLLLLLLVAWLFGAFFECAFFLAFLNPVTFWRLYTSNHLTEWHIQPYCG